MKGRIFLVLFSIICLLSISHSAAQVTEEWVRELLPYGWSTASGNAIAVDIVGNVYTFGSANGDMILIKHNSSGDTLWTRMYDHHTSDRGFDVTVDNSGNVFVTGPSTSRYGTSADAVIIKYNSNGDSLWVRRYDRASNSDWVLKVKTDSYGNVFAAGHSINSSNNYDYFIIKYDAGGVHQWARFYNGTTNQNDFFGGMDIDGSGNAYITVKSHSDLVSIKYDPAGNLQWLHKYPGAHGQTIKADSYGNAYVCGYAQNNFLTIKYNSTGDTVWTKMYDGGCSGNRADAAYSLAIDGSGNVFVTGGSVGCTDTDQDVTTIKYNSIGEEQWVRKHNGASLTGSDLGKEIMLDANGNVYVAGVSFEVNRQKYLTMKYDKDGNQKWLQTYGNHDTGTYTLNDMAINSSGNVYVTGSCPEPMTGGLKIGTVMYSQAGLRLTALLEGFYDNNSGNMVQDTVVVYLRNTVSPFAVVDSVKSILDSLGRGVFIFHNTTPGMSCFVSVKHRNSIEVWSNNGILISAGIVSFDFTTDASQAYGNNLTLKGAKYCIYSGDCDQDGAIDGTDQMQIENASSVTSTGYVITDVNGDLIVDGSDLLIAENNASNYVAVRNPIVGMSPGISHIRDLPSRSSSTFELHDNYPNPFNPSTEIRFSVAVNGYVTLKIYDMAGKEVAVLVNEMKTAGEHSVMFNASGLSSGTYFYKLTAGSVEQVKKMTLVK